MLAMHPKRREGKWEQLVYIDLLAGPGKGIDRKSRAEFDGSPLRALRVSPAFGRLFLGDKSEASRGSNPMAQDVSRQLPCRRRHDLLTAAEPASTLRVHVHV